MYQRYLKLDNILKSRSVLLLGPRQTGKSTFLKHNYPNARYVNLLQSDHFLEYSIAPYKLRQSLTEKDSLVIIDEIQKLPILLDEVQAIMLERPNIKFILTGSSARKLKRGQANLLAGRAHVKKMFPLTSFEVRDGDIHFNELLLKFLNRGGLPSFFDSEVYRQDLRNYVGTYLKEEIQAEGIVRGIESFSRFLEVASLTNAQQINYTEIASDAGIPVRLIREYYQILEDTLIGFQIPAFQKTVKRKPVSTAKFYLFDVGVANALCKRSNIEDGSELYGNTLEHFIAIELRSYLDYKSIDEDLSFWRTLSQIEVDFLIGDKVAIEVKSKKRISRRDCKGLIALSEEHPKIRRIIICNELNYRVEDNIEIMPIEYFLNALWGNEII